MHFLVVLHFTVIRSLASAAILSRTVRFLVERSGAADKAVRYRCCQLLGVWAIMWKQDEELPSTLADYVVLKMLPRLQDKV